MMWEKILEYFALKEKELTAKEILEVFVYLEGEE